MTYQAVFQWGAVVVGVLCILFASLSWPGVLLLAVGAALMSAGLLPILKKRREERARAGVGKD